MKYDNIINHNIVFDAAQFLIRMICIWSCREEDQVFLIL